MTDTLQRLFQWIDDHRAEMIEFQRGLTARPALGPENGGDGEAVKADFAIEEFARWKIPNVRRLEAPDARVRSGLRPNVVALLPGADSTRTLWIMSHLDVVPPGEPTLWSSDPWTLREAGGRLYGRGVEDNQQGLVASVFALRALLELGIEPRHDLGLVLVADEETGNAHGLDWLLARHADLFRRVDQVIVPDAGDPDGAMIEIAEKSTLWIKFRVRGKQCHASRPAAGLNANAAACRLVVELDRLKRKFGIENPLFDPPVSTFEPTKREANVPNINTLPGEDVFYLDCRILPEIDLVDVERAVTAICRKVEKATGAGIEFSYVEKNPAAPPTAPDSPVVQALTKAIRAVHGRTARLMGIGGGTVAACFRERGIPAAVYGTLDELAHQPDEYCVVDNLVADAKIFAFCALEKM